MKISEIIKYIDGELICGDLNKKINNIKIDSRKIELGDTFIGIKGEKYDGNEFYLDAIKKGAEILILDNKKIITKTEKNIILVDNSIEALQKIAKYKMSSMNIKTVAVTGSVGKTTTKDLIYNVLKKDYKVLKTDKNFNGQIGLPLTVMSLKDEDILVVEMGMNEKGAIEKLSSIVKPDIAVITNVGTSHIGKLGSRKKILKAKLEILKNIKKDGFIIINNDNDLLHKKIKQLKKYNVITYGINNKSDYKATNIKIEENKIQYNIKNKRYKIQLTGLGNIYNSMVAIIIGELLKVKKIDFKNIDLTDSRLQIINSRFKIIDDTYNASYESMINAIDTLNIVGKKRKIAVLGDIKELGKYSKKIHKKIGKYLKNIDILITVGKYSKYINKKAKIKNKYHFNNIEEAIIHIKKIIKDNDTILVKASHSMNFKEIVKNIIYTDLVNL